MSFKPTIIYAFVVVLAFVTASFSQGPPPAKDASSETVQTPRGVQGLPNVLRRQLGFSPDQMIQLRELTRQSRPLMQEANRALREANRELDLAIYADQIDEQTIADRVKIYQQAQARVAELRFKNELEIRKLLTPEQLIKFRELRERSVERRTDIRERRQQRNAGDPAQGPRPLRPRQD